MATATVAPGGPRLVEDNLFACVGACRPSAFEAVVLAQSGLGPEERETAWSRAMVNGRHYDGFTRRRDVELVERGLKPTEDFEIVFLGEGHVSAAMRRMLELGYKVGWTLPNVKTAKPEERISILLTPYHFQGTAESIVEGERRNARSGRRALVVGDKHTAEYDAAGMLPTAEALLSNSVRSVGVSMEFFHPDEAVDIHPSEMKASEFLAKEDVVAAHHPGVYNALRGRLREYQAAGIVVKVRGLETSRIPG